MNANNLTAALTTRFLDDNGIERFSASIGQIRYFTEQKVQATTSPTIPTNFNGSDYVAQFSVQLDDRWRMNGSYQWDPNSFRGFNSSTFKVERIGRETDLATIQMQRRIGVDGILNFSYRYRRGVTEQFDTSAVYPLSERWRVLGRWVYARKDLSATGQFIPSHRTLEADAGVEYEGCCVAVRLIGRHYVHDFTRETANAVMFELEFKGLGSFNPQTGDYLRRAILGYQ